MGRQDWIRTFYGALVFSAAMAAGCSKEPPKTEAVPTATSTAPATPPATPPGVPAAAAAAPAAPDPSAPAAADPVAPPPTDPAATAIGDTAKPLPSSIDPPGKSPKQKRREAKRAREAAKKAAGEGTEVKSGW
jgi:hypothetical protein